MHRSRLIAVYAAIFEFGRTLDLTEISYPYILDITGIRNNHIVTYCPYIRTNLVSIIRYHLPEIFNHHRTIPILSHQIRGMCR